MSRFATQEWELERAVQSWLEGLQAGTEGVPKDVKDILEENILPAIYNGEIRAAEPKSDHSEIGQWSSGIEAIAVLRRETGKTLIHRTAFEDLLYFPRWSLRLPHQNKPVY
jgi:hypothetical protein